MPVEAIDVPALVAIVMGMLVVLIPIAGLTLRFAIKPVTESFAKLREGGMEREKMEMMERRMALLEQELHGLGGMREELARVLEVADFQQAMRAPSAMPREIGR